MYSEHSTWRPSVSSNSAGVVLNRTYLIIGAWYHGAGDREESLYASDGAYNNIRGVKTPRRHAVALTSRGTFVKPVSVVLSLVTYDALTFGSKRSLFRPHRLFPCLLKNKISRRLYSSCLLRPSREVPTVLHS